MAKKISGSVGKGGKNVIDDTSGQLVVTDGVSTGEGNPSPSASLALSAPASPLPQSARVAFPIGDDFEFAYDPAEFGPAVSLDYELDVLAVRMGETPRVDVTLALLQDEMFVADAAGPSPFIDASATTWITLREAGLTAADFVAVDGGGESPDFGRPFEFGYAFEAAYSGFGLDVGLRLDNMQATVNTVPEPSAVWVVAALALAVLWRRRVRVAQS